MIFCRWRRGEWKPQSLKWKKNEEWRRDTKARTRSRRRRSILGPISGSSSRLISERTRGVIMRCSYKPPVSHSHVYSSCSFKSFSWIFGLFGPNFFFPLFNSIRLLGNKKMNWYSNFFLFIEIKMTDVQLIICDKFVLNYLAR